MAKGLLSNEKITTLRGIYMTYFPTSSTGSEVFQSYLPTSILNLPPPVRNHRPFPCNLLPQEYLCITPSSTFTQLEPKRVKWEIELKTTESQVAEILLSFASQEVIFAD